MKKILITALLAVFLSQSAFAQFFAGGGLSFAFQQAQAIGFGQSGTTDVRLFSTSIRPLVGYRFGIADAGLLFEYFNQSTSVNIPGLPNFSSIGIGIFGELQLFSRGNFSISGRGSFLYTTLVDLDYRELRIDLEPIFEYAIVDRLSFFTNVGLVRFLPAALDRPANTFVLSIFTGPTIGFRFFFE